MASENEKTKTSAAPKNEIALKRKVAPKQDEGQPKDKTTSDAEPFKDVSDAASSTSNYSRGEGQKPVSKAYKDNWNAIYGKKKKKKQ